MPHSTDEFGTIELSKMLLDEVNLPYVNENSAGGACAGTYVASIHPMPDGETRIEVEEHDEY